MSTISTGVNDCQVSVRANVKTSAHLKSVFKMSTVCSKSNASSETWTPLPDRFIYDHLVEMFPLFRRDFSWSTSRIWLRYTRSCSFHQIWQSTRLRSGLLAGHTWSGEVWCFMNHAQMHCLRCHVGWTPECLTVVLYVTLYWKLKYFVVNIWMLITRAINNIFL